MLNRGTCVKIVVVSLLAVTAQHVARLVVLVGTFSHFYQHYPGQCKKLENIQRGSEDFHTLPNGLTFITSGYRQQTMGAQMNEYFQRNDLKGRIYLFDLKKPDQGVKELKLTSTDKFNADTFHPHGISVWEDKSAGHHVLFVVNHPMEQPVADRIEKFIFDPDTLELKHHSYYSDNSMKVMNNVQATGENSLYFTNHQSSHSPAMQLMETWFLLPWTEVVYFDGKNYTLADGSLKSPNGIAMSADGRYIYVAACLGREIRVYRRNQGSSLTLQQIFPLDTFPDNILVDQKTGDLYIGCHPIGYQLLHHLEKPDGHLSPSQVLHLKVKDGNITSAQELLYDHGELISGSTSATIYDGKMLVGSIFHNLVLCDVNVPL